MPLHLTLSSAFELTYAFELTHALFRLSVTSNQNLEQ